MCDSLLIGVYVLTEAKETNNCSEGSDGSSDAESGDDSFINDEEIEGSESEEQEAWNSSQKRTPPKQPPQPTTTIEIISDDEVLTTSHLIF